MAVVRVDRGLGLIFIVSDREYPLDSVDVVEAIKGGNGGGYDKGYTVARVGEGLIHVWYPNLGASFDVRISNDSVRRVRALAKEALRLTSKELASFIKQLKKHILENRSLIFSSSEIRLVYPPEIYESPELQAIINAIFEERNLIKFVKATKILNRSLRNIGNGFMTYITKEDHYLVRIFPIRIDHRILDAFMHEACINEDYADRVTKLTLWHYVGTYPGDTETILKEFVKELKIEYDKIVQEIRKSNKKRDNSK